MGEAAGWLVSSGVTHVATEATGFYSMPVYYVLLEHGDFEKVLICNAAHVKNVPGRKTGYADAEWLAHLLECGLLAGSFIPQTRRTRTCDGVAGRCAEGLREESLGQGYSAASAAHQIHLMAHLSCWLEVRGLGPALLDESVIAARRTGGYAALRSARALAPLLDYLRGLGVAAPPRLWFVPFGRCPVPVPLSVALRVPFPWPIVTVALP